MKLNSFDTVFETGYILFRSIPFRQMALVALPGVVKYPNKHKRL